jgi:hypothetical protein
VLNIIKPGAAHLYNRSDVMYTSNAAAKFLQREVARRRAVIHNTTDQIHPGDATHPKMLSSRPPKIQQCIEELHRLGTSYSQVESNHILAYWNRFKSGLRTHWLRHSRAGEALLLAGCCKVEALFDESLRDEFKNYKAQKERHDIDGANSPNAPKSYFELAAKLANDLNRLLFTKIFPEDYGEPFTQVFRLVAPSKQLTANDMRDFLNMLRRLFIILDKNLKASGNGEEHEVRKFAGGVRKDERGNVVANGDLVGYAYLVARQEDLLQLVMQKMPASSAATMSNVPQIDVNDADNDAVNDDGDLDDTDSKRKRRTKSRSTNKKTKTPSSSDAGASSSTAHILQQLKSNAASSKYFELNRLLVKEISEQSAIESQIQSATRFVWETRKELMADGLEREAALEHPMYQEALETVNVLKVRRTELQEMVEKTKADISEMDAEQLAVPTALFDGDVTATPRPSLEPASLRNFREGRTFPTNDVDGSVLGDLPDNTNWSKLMVSRMMMVEKN